MKPNHAPHHHKVVLTPEQATVFQNGEVTFEAKLYLAGGETDFKECAITWLIDGNKLIDIDVDDAGNFEPRLSDPSKFKIKNNFITIKFNDSPLGSYLITIKVEFKGGEIVEDSASAVVQPDINDLINKATEFVNKINVQASPKGLSVSLQRPSDKLTDDIVLWSVIKHQTDQLKFKTFETLFNDNDFQTRGVDAYNTLKKKIEENMKKHVATAFDRINITDYVKNELSKNSGFSVDNTNALVTDYFDKINTSPYLVKINTIDDNCIEERLNTPVFLELIWSYWHEEGMLAQTMNAICLRFQNKSNSSSINKLAHLATSPLKSLSNLIWGYIQDEPNRLTVNRRAFEYMQHYGLPLLGKAINKLDVVESRSKFLEALHNLLNRCALFYKEVDDTTIYADAFPVLKALAEVHLVLAEGANNQYGDLPWAARADMMLQQLIIARPEMREFLTVRTMVPYEEQWMGHVDTMKRLQNWSDVTITHFHNLAVWGEQILLSIRHGDWNDSDVDPAQAANWAKFWRTQIQGYIHAYRAVTGVDLTTEPINSVLPGILLQKRLAAQGAGI